MKVQGVKKFGHILICLLPGVHFNMNAQNKQTQNSNNNKKNYCKARQLEEVINNLRALSHEEKQREPEKHSENQKNKWER